MLFYLRNFTGTCASVEMLKGYMLICRNAEGVHGQRKVGNPWSMLTIPKLFMRWRITFERRIPNEMLDNVITNFNMRVATSHSDLAIRSLDRAHHKISRCARKMVVYEEKTYTTQNLHVCKTSLWNTIAKYVFQYKMLLLSKMNTSFWTTLIAYRSTNYCCSVCYWPRSCWACFDVLRTWCRWAYRRSTGNESARLFGSV